ncbi:M23 family metallopeptidase [Labedella phragmitis]|uniref:M23 family metallopeptidase n=1 Tax=Labedella phragmitis TaxID=2498849 RepID=A0A3S3Z9Y8_9MICO|nr:M23 family metallopeptidase [Labedella phragmitis]RWZ50961.1 M23 family metallopeptidase [Labedella phragmitis]
MPASLPGDDAPLRRVRNRRTPAADRVEATPQPDGSVAITDAATLIRSAEDRSVEATTASPRRSERRARRMVTVADGVADSAPSPIPESAAEVPDASLGRRARRTRAAVEVASGGIVSDWMGTHTEHDVQRIAAQAASLAAVPEASVDSADEAAPSRRARRARQVVALESSVLDEAESLPVVSRRSRRSSRVSSDERLPLLTVEPRATLEPAPVAANPTDLVVATDADVSHESFTIVQDDPADVASHNAIVDEREAVAVMVEDVSVEPVIASISPTIVLDAEEALSAAPLLGSSLSVEPIDVETTSSIVAVGHVTEQVERPVFVPRTELDAPVAAVTSVSAAPAPVISRRSRAGRVAAKSFSFAAFSVAGLLTLATSLPANALLSADDVAAQKVLVTQGDTTTTSFGQTQTVAASGETPVETIKRDSYGAVSALEAAKALGIQPEATFSNDPNGTIQWPFAVGVHIGSGYGARPGCPIGCSTDHKGQDFNPGYGAPIQSIADGVVIESTDSGGAFGVKIVIEHVIDGQIVHSLYGHMINGSRTVEVGDPVTVGQVIGQTGNTGRSTGPHLHFEIMLNGTEHVDPLAWLYANAN